MKGCYFLDQENKVWVREEYVNRISYCDGAELEQQVYDAVRNSKDISVLSEELESHIVNWPTLCFLSRKRSNLLRPFAPLFKDRYILEIGCGAGPITRFLGECGAHVYAIEPNMQRARIAAERCRDLPNVKVICDDIGNFESDRSFDGVIQVGVLEYATRYSDNRNALLDFLTHLKKFISSNGFLITAIENQLGLKYFSGYLEDHAGVLMHSINDNYQPGEATTLGRTSLMRLLEHAGFLHNHIFLPFPDYKLPTLVFYPGFNEKNKNCRISIESILSNISYQDQQQYTPLFSLDKALPLIAQNDLLYDLSNSFCIFSQFEPELKVDENILFAFYRTERKKEYCKETLFKKENDEVKVIRNYLDQTPPKKESIISFDNEEPAYSGTLYHYELVKIVNRNNWEIEQLQAWLSGWLTCLKLELIERYALLPHDFLRLDLSVNSKYIDALPINLIMQENRSRFIDLEISLHQDVEWGYIIFRAIYVSLTRLSSVAQPRESKYIEADNIIYQLFLSMGYRLTAEQLNRYYEAEASLVSSVGPLQIQTLKGSITRLRVRPSIAMAGELGSKVESLLQQLQQKQNDIDSLYRQVQEKQAHIGGLHHEVHSLRTSRKRMIKQFIKRTFPVFFQSA